VASVVVASAPPLPPAPVVVAVSPAPAPAPAAPNQGSPADKEFRDEEIRARVRGALAQVLGLFKPDGSPNNNHRVPALIERAMWNHCGEAIDGRYKQIFPAVRGSVKENHERYPETMTTLNYQRAESLVQMAINSGDR